MSEKCFSFFAVLTISSLLRGRWGEDSGVSGALPNQWTAALPVDTIPTKHTLVTVIPRMRKRIRNHLKAASHKLLSGEDAILVCIQSGVILVLTNGVNTKNS